MHIKNCQRDTLLKPLQAVSGIVERRQTLPILSNVLIETGNDKLKLTATDLEIQIAAETAFTSGDPQSLTVTARKLQDLLRALPEDTAISLDAKDSKMTLKAGKSKFQLQTLPAADFPRITKSSDRVQAFTIKQKDLKHLIKLTEFAMAQQDIRYYLNGVLFVLDGSRLIAVATDGHRMSYAHVAIEGSFTKQEVIVPRKTILELSKLLQETDEPVSVEILGNQIRLSFANIELVSKVIDGKFPDFNRVIPSGHTKHVVLDRALLLHTLQRAAILSNEKFRGVRVVLESGSLKIVCTNAEQEEAEEQLDVAYEGDGLDVGFNINYLLDVMSTLTQSELKLSFNDSTSSALITIPDRDDYKYVVMPMRI
jgi:DNA polymerase III subunit beta